MVSPIRALLAPAALASALLVGSLDAEAASLGLHRIRITSEAAYGAVGGQAKPVRLTLDPRL